MIERQGEIDEFNIIMGDFNTILSEMHRSRRQKILEDTVELKSTFKQLYIIDSLFILQQEIAPSSQVHMI